MKSDPQDRRFGRRDFLASAPSLAAAALLGLSDRAAADPPPETARLRLVQIPGICQAPQYVAEALLRAEGFTDVQYLVDQVKSGREP